MPKYITQNHVTSKERYDSKYLQLLPEMKPQQDYADGSAKFSTNKDCVENKRTRPLEPSEFVWVKCRPKNATVDHYRIIYAPPMRMVV